MFIPPRAALHALSLIGLSACPDRKILTTTTEDTEEHSTPAPDPDPCVEKQFGPQGGRIDRGDALLVVPAGAVAEGTVLEMCETAPEPGRYEALSSGWSVSLEAGTLRGSLEMTLRLRDTESAALFVSGYGDPVRSILAWSGAEGELTTRLFESAVVTAARDERVLTPYVPRPTSADLLLVVDNSCSNLDEQLQLATEMPALLAQMEANGVDYHIGVISTDVEDPTQQGQLVQVGGTRWVDMQTPGVEDLLAQMIEMGIEGSMLEQGLAATLAALTQHADGANAGFFRREAALSVVVMSDQDDQGDTDPQSVVELLLQEELERPVVEFHSLVNPELGQRYLLVTEEIGGVWSDISGGDWQKFVARVSDRLAVEASMELPREKWPEVWLLPPDGGEPVLAPEALWRWHPEKQLLWLTQSPPEGVELLILAVP